MQLLNVKTYSKGNNMTLDYKNLKERQRKERESHPENSALRIHRSLSWLDRAEQCDDLDGRFIFLWIAFNAAYANELGEITVSESELFDNFLARLIDLDNNNRLYSIVWQRYPNAIRVLLDNKFIFQPFWNYHNGYPGYENWEQMFKQSKAAVHRALADNDTATVLSIVFKRLYTLRNQIVHGGSTYNSQANRDQMRDAVSILGDFVPAIIEIMLDNAESYWGEACYPVVNE